MRDGKVWKCGSVQGEERKCERLHLSSIHLSSNIHIILHFPTFTLPNSSPSSHPLQQLLHHSFACQWPHVRDPQDLAFEGALPAGEPEALGF
jgi:hypothetical protein